MTLHNIRLNSIYSQSFIQIDLRVSEILKVSPKMNAISADFFSDFSFFETILWPDETDLLVAFAIDF